MFIIVERAYEYNDEGYDLTGYEARFSSPDRQLAQAEADRLNVEYLKTDPDIFDYLDYHKQERLERALGKPGWECTNYEVLEAMKTLDIKHEQFYVIEIQEL